MYKRRKLVALFVAFVLLLQGVSTGFSVENAPSLSTPDAPAQRVRELTELRETNSETYLMSDGTYECVVYPDNKYYPVGDTLELIDNTIKATRDGYTNTANSFGVTFSSASTAEVEMEYQGKSVTFTPVVSEADKLGLASQAVRVGSQGTAPVLSQLTQTGDNTITYTNAFSNTDLTYVLANSMLKEYIILKNASAPNSFSFLFNMEGLTLRTVEGVSSLYDSDGTAVFTLSKLFAIDADGAYTEAVTYTVAPGSGRSQAIITITLSEDYLNAEDRVFPVVIDPTLTIQSYETADASVCSATPTTNYQMAYNLRTGYEPDYGTRRTYIKFNIPSSISGKRIWMGSLRMEHLSGVTPTVRAYRVYAPWSSGSITWNNRPSYAGAGYSGISELTPPGNWYQMNVTEIVQYWALNMSQNYGFMIKDVTETDPDHWSTFYSSDAESTRRPILYISYSDNDYSGGGDEGGGEVTEPTDPPTPPAPTTPPPEPDVTLYLYYDSAYASRYGASSVINRITNHAEALQNKYLQEFGIYVDYTDPVSYTSYADGCNISPTAICVCLGSDGNDLCIDATTLYTPEGDPWNPPHHTNYITNLHRIPTPDALDEVNCVFNGHKLCGTYFLDHVYDYDVRYNGMAALGQRKFMITNRAYDEMTSQEHIMSERRTFVHEFGHAVGAKDHYDSSYSDPDMLSTEEMNNKNPNSQYLYNEQCIYGERREDADVTAELRICPGCKHTIETALGAENG